MSPTDSQSIVDLLLASGVPSREEALQLAQNMNGGSWTAQVLDSGKVDEQRFLSVIGNFFRVPVISIDPKTIEREMLSILPSFWLSEPVTSFPMSLLARSILPND